MDMRMRTIIIISMLIIYQRIKKVIMNTLLDILTQINRVLHNYK